MPTYRIDIPASGKVLAQALEHDSDDVTLLFDKDGARLVDGVSKQGVSALSDNADFAHVMDLIVGKSLTGIYPNHQPGRHALVFS
ncbi:hypothetical protein [Pantoea ananatis]|uniref:hypothetical protein n=1 Tax=Pantoea ananas TaxID=553 RepID=UPI000CF403B2|nr:hypothetical protein [Pantoea ananatis]PQK85733.1 hypothetical protein CG431_11460 [Pantoea ananatis]